MKKKSILVIILVFLIVFLIYTKTKDEKVYYVNLNENYLNEIGNNYHKNMIETLKNQNILEEEIEFKYENARVSDWINTIKNNDYIYVNGKKHTIQNALIKADLLILEIGKNDLDYTLSKQNKIDIYNYLDTLLLDMDTLLEETRKYTKEKIILIEFKDESEYLTYFYQKVENMCNTYKIDYIESNQNINDEITSKFTFKY